MQKAGNDGPQFSLLDLYLFLFLLIQLTGVHFICLIVYYGYIKLGEAVASVRSRLF